MYHANHQIF